MVKLVPQSTPEVTDPLILSYTVILNYYFLFLKKNPRRGLLYLLVRFLLKALSLGSSFIVINLCGLLPAVSGIPYISTLIQQFP